MPWAIAGFLGTARREYCWWARSSVVEQWTFNPSVVGSIPTGPTTTIHFPREPPVLLAQKIMDMEREQAEGELDSFAFDTRGESMGTTLAIRRRSVSMAAASAALSALLILSAPSAGATVVDRERYEFTDSFTFDDCGFEVSVESAGHGVASIRVGTGELDSAFFAHNKYWYTDTYSANGKFFTITGNGLFQEIRAIPRGGSLFEFTSVEAGQPFTVTDMNGEVLFRDRGAIIQTILFDTEGDDVPGGIFIEEVDLRVAGPHPGFFVDPSEACVLLAP